MVFDFLKKKKNEGKEPLLLCPRCKVNMKKIEKNQFIIDVCKKCGGLWLDKEEVQKISRYIDAHNSENKINKTIRKSKKSREK